MFKRKQEKKFVLDANQEQYSIDLFAGVDAGSTETRVALADYEDVALLKSIDEDSSIDQLREALHNFGETYKIPSSYADIGNDNREIVKTSNNLVDNLDSRIHGLFCKAEKPMITYHRILRGSRLDNAVGVVTTHMDTNTEKVDNVTFYLNVIDGLGYAIVQKYSGRIPSTVNVKLSVSVRPRELQTFSREKMRDNLVGKFCFTTESIDIQMNITSVDFTTEPEAQLYGASTVYGVRSQIEGESACSRIFDLMNDSDVYMHIEGGGSSIGVELMRNGNIIANCSRTFNVGGKYLANTVADAIKSQLGRNCKHLQAEAAVIKCRLKDGNNDIDVAPIVAKCKSLLALRIFECLKHEVLDMVDDIGITDLAFISLGGRLFAQDAAGVSVAQYLEQLIKNESPNTEIIQIPETYIPHGNLIIAMDSDD